MTDEPNIPTPSDLALEAIRKTFQELIVDPEKNSLMKIWQATPSYRDAIRKQWPPEHVSTLLVTLAKGDRLKEKYLMKKYSEAEKKIEVFVHLLLTTPRDKKYKDIIWEDLVLGDRKSYVFKDFKNCCEQSSKSKNLSFYLDVKTLIHVEKKLEGFMTSFHDLVINTNQFEHLDGSTKRELLKIHDDYWDLKNVLKYVREKFRVHFLLPLKSEIILRWAEYVFTKSFKSAFPPERLPMFIHTLAKGNEEEEKCLMRKYDELGKKIEPFLDFLRLHEKHKETLYAIATGGYKTFPFTDFKKYCEESSNAEEWRCLFKYEPLIHENDYRKFMVNFHESVIETNQFKDLNLGGSNNRELVKVHDFYWDTKKDKPHDLIKETKKKGKVEENGSNSEVAKVKTEKKKKRENVVDDAKKEGVVKGTHDVGGDASKTRKATDVPATDKERRNGGKL